MTILTPTFAERAGPMHVTAAHEPTKAGEVPAIAQQPNTPEAVVQQKQPLKVALVGTAPSSRMLAPFNDTSWAIWACSPGNMNQIPRADAWFELHSNLLWPEHESYGKPYIEWLKTVKFPVYMQETWPNATGDQIPVKQIVPSAIPFPKGDLVEEFGDEFFTSSFAWMMALAMKMGAIEIALYGIDMASRDEYIRQRPGFYYFKREAIKRGIKVSAPHESDIMQSPPLYAYTDSTPFGRKILARRQEISGRISGMEQQHAQLSQNIHYLKGAQEDLDYFESIWSGVSNDMGRLQHENAKLRARNAELEAKVASMTIGGSLTIGQPVITMTPPQPMLMPGVWTVSAGAPAPKRRRRRKANDLSDGSDHGKDAQVRAPDEQPVQRESGHVGDIYVQPNGGGVHLERLRPDSDQAHGDRADANVARDHGTESGAGQVQHDAGAKPLDH